MRTRSGLITVVLVFLILRSGSNEENVVADLLEELKRDFKRRGILSTFRVTNSKRRLRCVGNSWRQQQR